MRPYLKVKLKNDYEYEFVIQILPLFNRLKRCIEVHTNEVVFWRPVSKHSEYFRKDLEDQWYKFTHKLYSYRQRRKKFINLNEYKDLELPPFKEQTVKDIFDSLDDQTKKCVYLFVGSTELLSVEGNRLIDIFVKLKPEEKKIVANILMSSLGLFVE